MEEVMAGFFFGVAVMAFGWGLWTHNWAGLAVGAGALVLGGFFVTNN
jgi:hypothetical protein